MKGKKLLSGLAGLVMLAGCNTITPHGSIDVSYIPEMREGKKHEQVWKTELDASLETKLDDIIAEVGARQRTFATHKEGLLFTPFKQDYDAYGSVQYRDWTFYIIHTCEHPVGEEEMYIYDNEGTEYILNYSDITEIGVKYEW